MPLLVQQYLAAHTLADLQSAYGITAKRHGEYPNLVFLKYNQITSPLGEPIVQQCRGIILDESDDWRVVSYPFDKFFNYGEPNAAAIDWSAARVFEKLDGSLMTLYWYRGDWRVASNGLPDASGRANDLPISFAELFWKVWKDSGYELPQPPRADDGPGTSYLFELMTPHNRIVVQHSESRLVFIGCRDLSDMCERDPQLVAQSHPTWQTIQSLPIGTLADCLEAAQKLRGIDGEGFVVRDDQFRRIKVKSPQYVALAHLKDTLSPRSMLEIIRKNESAEFLNYFPEMRPVYEDVSNRFNALCEKLEAEYAAHKDIAVQKDFSAAIQKSVCTAALFALRTGKAKTVREFFATVTQQAIERVLGV